MILVDANLLLYAENSLVELHPAAREWWDAQLSGTTPVGLCWPVITAFIRIGTNSRIQTPPLTSKEAALRVQSWFAQPCVRLIEPTSQHWIIFQKMLIEGSATANLVTDARLAALAVEHGCVLCSADAVFARFPGLKWKNPLVAK